MLRHRRAPDIVPSNLILSTICDQSAMQSPSSPDRFATILAGVVYAVTAIFLFSTPYLPNAAVSGWDFIHFWSAGRAWLSGLSPYDASLAADSVPAPFVVRPFFYPPMVRPLFEIFGFFDFATARAGFAAVSAALWIGVGILTSRALPTEWPAAARLVALPLAIGFLIIPVRLSTEIGQVAVLVVAAVAALLWSKRTIHSWITVGLVLMVLSLKPQIGLPLAVVIGLRWGDWRSVGLATGLVLALFLYGCGGSPGSTVSQFIANAGAYSQFPENAPGATSGLPLVLSALGLPSFSGFAYLAAAMVGAVIIAFSASTKEAALLWTAVFSLLTQPSHGHDYLVLIPMIPIILRQGEVWRYGAACGALLISQGPMLATLAPSRVLADHFLFSAVIDTAGIALIAVGVLGGAMCGAPTGGPDRPTDRLPLDRSPMGRLLTDRRPTGPGIKAPG